MQQERKNPSPIRKNPSPIRKNLSNKFSFARSLFFFFSLSLSLSSSIGPLRCHRGVVAARRASRRRSGSSGGAGLGEASPSSSSTAAVAAVAAASPSPSAALRPVVAAARPLVPVGPVPLLLLPHFPGTSDGLADHLGPPLPPATRSGPPPARGAPAREVEVAVVEGAEPLLVDLPLGVDAGDVRVDGLELVDRLFDQLVEKNGGRTR